jgi:uncharacterized membrane protein
VKDKNEVKTISQSISFSGPLPPAAEFVQYDKALPGTAERILVLTEREFSHRHKNEDKALDILSRGQIFSFIISILSLGAVCLCVLFAQPGASIAPALIAIPSLISVFFNRKK